MWEFAKNKEKEEKLIKGIFSKELQAYSNPKGEFIRYRWYKPKTNKIADKLSYVCGYKS